MQHPTTFFVISFWHEVECTQRNLLLCWPSQLTNKMVEWHFNKVYLYNTSEKLLYGKLFAAFESAFKKFCVSSCQNASRELGKSRLVSILQKRKCRYCVILAGGKTSFYNARKNYIYLIGLLSTAMKFFKHVQLVVVN